MKSWETPEKEEPLKGTFQDVTDVHVLLLIRVFSKEVGKVEKFEAVEQCFTKPCRSLV